MRESSAIFDLLTYIITVYNTKKRKKNKQKQTFRDAIFN